MAEDKRIRPEELAWWRSNIDDLRDMTSSDRILRGMLWATLLGGLLLQVVGWLIPEGRLSELVANVRDRPLDRSGVGGAARTEGSEQASPGCYAISPKSSKLLGLPARRDLAQRGRIASPRSRRRSMT